MELESIRKSEIYCSNLVEAHSIMPFVDSYKRGGMFSTQELYTEPVQDVENPQKYTFTLDTIGDFLYDQVFNISFPSLTYDVATKTYARWCRNPGHNAIKKMTVYVDAMELVSIDAEYLDFVAKYTESYNVMVGNIQDLINPMVSEFNTTQTIKAFTTHIPLPFPWCRSGQSFPLSHIRGKQLKVVVELRSIEELVLSVNPLDIETLGIVPHNSTNVLTDHLTINGSIECTLSSYYGVFTALESAILKSKPISLNWECMHVQQIDTSGPFVSEIKEIIVDKGIVIKDIHVALQNITVPNERSNYTQAPVFARTGSIDPYVTLIESPAPMAKTAIHELYLKHKKDAEEHYRYNTNCSKFFEFAIPHARGTYNMPGHCMLTYAIGKAGTVGHTGTNVSDSSYDIILGYKMASPPTKTNLNEGNVLSYFPMNYYGFFINEDEFMSIPQIFQLVLRYTVQKAVTFLPDGTILMK